MEDKYGKVYRVPPKKLAGLDLKKWIEIKCKTEDKNIVWIYEAKNIKN
jgi:hypothetical protein